MIMPIYEYKCQNCGREVEVFCKLYDEPEYCDACNGLLEKLISNSTFNLKGSGWYATDYKQNLKD